MKKLIYNKEAANWNEALPLGNGRIGAMAFGGVYFDRFQMNEDTLWSGNPDNKNEKRSLSGLDEVRKLVFNREYLTAQKKLSETMFGKNCQAYMSFGDIILEIQNAPIYRVSDDDKIEKRYEYKRELNLENALFSCEYNLNEQKIKKQAFTSFSDDVFVIHIEFLKPTQEISIRLAPMLKSYINPLENGVEINGICPTNAYIASGKLEYNKNEESIAFCGILKTLSDGTSYSYGSGVTICNPSYVDVVFSIKTSFNGYNKMPLSNGKNCKEQALTSLENALKYSYQELLDRHIKEYQKYFSRVNFSLGENSFVPIDQRLKNVENDINLCELLFDYGRYLLISSSFENTQVANLQGIWNNRIIAPWHSNYTMNINTEMNYWLAEVCNLPECHKPLFLMLKDFCEKGNVYGLSGWASWHNSDIWRFNYEADKNVMWGFWLMGGFWCCRHLWEHFQYSNDVKFLEEYLNVYKGAMDFACEWLIKDKEDFYTTNPSTSPENSYIFENQEISICSGSTMDLSIIRELLTNGLKWLNILNLDTKKYESYLKKLRLLKIANDGRLMEWNEEFDEKEKGHRHLSHLYCLYPSDIISENQELINACKKSLEFRLENGGGYTGWSAAWVINLFARLKNGEESNKYIKNVLKESIYPNMFDAHPPFQIDGNFGITSAISEMLLQSHRKENETVILEILPAIPTEWKTGKIDGLVGRGNKIVNIEWNENNVFVQVISKDNTKYRVVYNGNRVLKIRI